MEKLTVLSPEFEKLLAQKEQMAELSRESDDILRSLRMLELFREKASLNTVELIAKQIVLQLRDTSGDAITVLLFDTQLFNRLLTEEELIDMKNQVETSFESFASYTEWLISEKLKAKREYLKHLAKELL